MKLFHDWEGRITIPLSPSRKEVVGGNTICQQAFRGCSTNAKADAFDKKGYFTIKTDLAFPFDDILLRLKGVRRIETERLVLCAPEPLKLHELNSDTMLEWDDLDTETSQMNIYCEP